DPASADERHETAVGTRRVILWPEPDGMATLAATLTADEAMTAMRALTGLAHLARAAGDDRPIDVLRADVFADTFAAALADPRLPAEQRARPAVGLTIDLATLAHLAEHPGHLDGYGPIPPVLARRIAGGGDWHRLITDPVSGALLDYGRTAYRPPADLVEFVVARDRTCRFPTCARPARLTDIDHAQPWHQGGSTSAANCGALCRSDHRQKTSGNTQLHSHPDGSATWTMASGHTYHQPAIDFCPEHTQHMKTIRAETANKTDRWDTHSEARPPDHCKQPSAEADATHDAPALTATTEDHTGNESGTDPPPF
ncbi:MAG: DUF222 domain-containing protein, partial [Actinomycetota bacterium]